MTAISTPVRVLEDLVATLRLGRAFEEVTVGGGDLQTSAFPRADVTLESLERVAADDTAAACWRLTAGVRISVREVRSDLAVRRACDLAEQAAGQLLADRFRGGLCQDLPAGPATEVLDTRPVAGAVRPLAEVCMRIRCHFQEVLS